MYFRTILYTPSRTLRMRRHEIKTDQDSFSFAHFLTLKKNLQKNQFQKLTQIKTIYAGVFIKCIIDLKLKKHTVCIHK